MWFNPRGDKTPRKLLRMILVWELGALCGDARSSAREPSARSWNATLSPLCFLLLIAVVFGLGVILVKFCSDLDEGKSGHGAAASLARVSVGRGWAERIPRAEVAKHNTKADCWIVVHNLVLNVTHYIPVHPGGESFLTDSAGQDATKSFDTVHDLQDLELYAPELIIGVAAD